ncbi:ankyrin repeat and zinc finger domain-containing protein 1 isoform X6 [Peromyscus californicus insignis]|uniref:ankyrin repeat and zinc finger domain-containing protein 1 isoform X6 n=1 Tax=Peromyscus californicus insignis TaxID=564181 RepID=UPI0022A796C7|nr:ankyrin repeat and zinc finger domain-containing protein 1 isoform X6 [Peromyscus californicus insignis]
MSPAPGAALAPASVSLLDLSAEAPLVRGLSLVSQAPAEALAGASHAPCPGESTLSGRKVSPCSLDISEKLFCSACDQIFQNHQEQREHYKLDWHRFNLKQRLKNKPLLSASDFEKQSSTGDLSSISGSEDSDSSSEEDLLTLDEGRAEFEKPNRPRGFYPHRVLFKNAQGQFLYAYRCVLGPHQHVECFCCIRHIDSPRKSGVAATEPAKWRSQALRGAHGCGWAFCWCHFSRDVRDLLAGPTWAKALGEAEIILLRAPRSGRSLFFGGQGAPLQKDDSRLWDIPLTTRRPTFGELQRVLHKLTTLQVYDEDPRELVRFYSPEKHWKPVREERKKATDKEKTKVPSDGNKALGQDEESLKQGSESQEEDGSQVELELVELTLGTLDLREFEVLPKRRRRKKKKERSQDQQCGTHVTLLQQSQDEPLSQADQVVTAKGPDQPELWDMLLSACRAGEVEVLKLQLATGPVDPGVRSLLNAPLGSGGFTLLHAAAAAGRGLVVRLLLEAGADPTVQDSRARPPYTVAADKSTRNEFRRFMEKNLDAYDYNKARVPGPLTQEMEARQAARKKEQKAARRQREQRQQKQREQEEQEQEEQRRFAALSDREKRALAAERRLAAQLGAPSPPVPDSVVVNAGRCWSCGMSLQGLTPFHYLDFSFCSTRCLRDHRSQAGRPSS